MRQLLALQLQIEGGMEWTTKHVSKVGLSEDVLINSWHGDLGRVCLIDREPYDHEYGCIIS